MNPRASLALILLGTGLGLFSGWVYRTALKPLPNGAPDVVCWEMPQVELKSGGWQRVPEVERGQLAYRAARGRVSMREETSLQCRQYANGDPQMFLAREWWWRLKR